MGGREGVTCNVSSRLTVSRLCTPVLIDGVRASSTNAFTFDISTYVSQVLS